MKQSIQTNLLGSKVVDGERIDMLENRRLSYYGLKGQVTIRAVFYKEGGICFLLVDETGKCAEVYPCCVRISE